MKIKSFLKSLPERKSYVREEFIRQENVLDCSYGSNPFGVSEKVVLAAKNYYWSGIYRYTDPFHEELKQKIAQFWADCASLRTEQIHIAAGAMAVLERLNKIFIEPGSKVLGYSPQFTEYVTEVEVSGGSYEAVILKPEENFKFYPERLLKMINPDYCLVYLDNPNNPTGQVIDLEAIEEIVREAGKKEVVVLVDEAFGDYMEKERSAINLINKYQNLMVVRSFSKGYGLASLRVGYGIFSPKLALYYEKVNIPFAASAFSCYLAEEALSDEQFIRQCQEMTRREKGKLIRELKQRGYLISETLDSCPIFVLGHKDDTLDLKKELLVRGILTQGGEDFRNLGSNYVRINIPAKAEDFLARL